MQLSNIKTFFSFPTYLASLNSINTVELMCLGNSKDLRMFTWFSNHLSLKMSSAVAMRDSLNPESMRKKSFLSFKL